MDRLNKNEQRVVQEIRRAGPRGLTIESLATRCFGKSARANSWARNSLRKPRKFGLIERTGPGHYTVTSKGRTALANSHHKTASKSAANRKGAMQRSQKRPTRKPATSSADNDATNDKVDGESRRPILTTLTIRDFKSLKDLTIELGQVNVFVGANGAGKSCLLEAIGLLGASAAGAIDDQALLRRGVRPGVPELYKSSFSSEKMPTMISLRVHMDQAEYHAYITNPVKAPKPYWAFSSESLKFKGEVIASRGPRGNATDLEESVPLENNRSISVLLRANRETPHRVRELFSVLDDFAIFAPVTPVLRGIAIDTAPRSPVGLYGGQLAEAIALLNAQKSTRAAVQDALSMMSWANQVVAGEPKRRFLSPSVPTSRLVVEFQDRFMARNRNTLSGYDASEGALYILFMLVLAIHPRSPQVFAVDNFDQALNPRTARELTRRFVSHVLKSGRQAFLTTHNPLVLDGLALDNDRVRLFTVSRNRSGFTQVKRVPIANLAALKAQAGDYAVSRLWIEGRIGGMPDV